MGGPGSGWKNDRAQTVEECLSITIGRFKPGDLHPGSSSVGSLCWNGSDGPLTVGLGYTLYSRDGRVAMCFQSAELGFSIDVRLRTSRPSFGGLRWWFECPGPSRGAGCGRLTATLYLPVVFHRAQWLTKLEKRARSRFRFEWCTREAALRGKRSRDLWQYANRAHVAAVLF